MTRRIERAAVLGSGVMGAQIAAHLANAGVPTVLLDIAPAELLPGEGQRGLALQSPEVRNRIVAGGLEKARKIKPAAFFTPETAGLIRTGNLEDHLSWLGEADWIIEAVVENLEIKRQLLSRVDTVRKPGAIVSSNTSGIPIAEMGRTLSADFRSHFVGTHFFNPPRYLRLLEIIRTPETSGEVACFLSGFCDRVLGKNIVYCKDTPNFIANRIGTFSGLYAMRVMQEMELTVEEVDAITGPVIGHAKSATYRTFDLAGIDTAVNVADHLYQAVPQDERREVFVIPDFLNQMVKRGWLGDKTGQGFYQKTQSEAGREILALDYRKMEYRPRAKVRFPSIDVARNMDDLDERSRLLIYGKDRVGEFLWKTTSETLIYAANRIPEICDDIVQIDRAVRWGFNYQRGPFELWDALGVEKSVKRMEAEGKAIPKLAQELLSAGQSTFYTRSEGHTRYFDLRTQNHQPLASPPGITLLADLKEQKKVIRENAGATLVDLGDGVACLEFHTKMNAIGADTVQMMNFAVKEVTENFEGLVIGNQADNFCVGANIMMLLLGAQEGEWDELDLSIRSFQKANMALRYSPRPVVIAPHGLTLGGGCEIVLHGDRVRAAAETYLGLVEVGVGLIPAGGGVKEMLARTVERIPDRDRLDPVPYLKRTFETIGMAKVATSAAEARNLGFLREVDTISMNRDRLIEDAKQEVLALVKSGYRPLPPRSEIMAFGEPVLATLKLGIYLMKQAGYLSEYDQHIGNKLAWIMCGGDIKAPRPMPEQYFLDLERQAFLSLCGERKTQERIQHMLQTGKPLRN